MRKVSECLRTRAVPRQAVRKRIVSHGFGTVTPSSDDDTACGGAFQTCYSPQLHTSMLARWDDLGHSLTPLSAPSALATPTLPHSPPAHFPLSLHSLNLHHSIRVAGSNITTPHQDRLDDYVFHTEPSSRSFKIGCCHNADSRDQSWQRVRRHTSAMTPDPANSSHSAWLNIPLNFTARRPAHAQVHHRQYAQVHAAQAEMPGRVDRRSQNTGRRWGGRG
jgi:hypothetical protein